MNKRRLFIFTMTCLCSFGFTSHATAAEDEWQALLDPELSRWQTYLGYPNPDTPVADLPRNDQGEYSQPVGYNRNARNVFSVQSVDGEAVLRISGEIYGGIYTRKSYSNYHLRLQFKWGDKKWHPRLDLAMDSGILYHAVGEHGVDYWRAWPRSQEFQVIQQSEEGTTGDWWKIADSRIQIRALQAEEEGRYRYSPQGPLLVFGGEQGVAITCRASHNHEKPAGQWNTLELIAFGDKSLHIVNGEVVMALSGSSYPVEGGIQPLTAGSILLQSEAAEVFYRRIEIKPIDRIPSKYQERFAD